MYLKRLDLQGFKSFPERVKLEFNKGITCVVGPNGSGKSNISDAVRWVLGEQKVKSLRGDKMEDIIFAGTQNRRPLGFAEVSMTIDNMDHKIPIDFSEVTVTRRVYRSGESEYLINGAVCRLKDVYELFMDTGVGREGYSIIGQGRIDEILSSKSEDRRRLFEEAAGIVKFKNRRQEAAVKLERERQNLQRVEDIIRELSERIEPLQADAEKAKEFIALKEKLKVTEIGIFQSQEKIMAEETEKILENKKIIEDELRDLEQQALELKQKISSLEETENDYTKKIQDKNQEIIELRGDIEKKQGLIQLYQEQAGQIDRERERLAEEAATRREKIDAGKRDYSLYEVKFHGSEGALLAEESRLAEKEEEFNTLSKELSERQSHIEEYKADMIERIRVTTDVKGNIQRTQAILEQFTKRKEQLTAEKAYAISQTEASKIHAAALDKKIQENTMLEQNTAKNLEETAVQRDGLIQTLSEKRLEMEKLDRELSEKRSRFRVLSEMEKEHEGFYKSVKNILKKKEEGGVWQGIHGAAGELITVDKGLEIAIETALGANLQSIVTQCEEDAQLAIDYLKRNALGRATFLPISAIQGRELGLEKERLLKEKGVLGVAKNLVSYDKIYDGIFTSLLGRVIIVDKIENGIAIAKKYKHAYRLITLEGDVFSPGGAITGGSIAKKSTGIFSRSREMVELKEVLTGLYEKTKELKDESLQQEKQLEQYNEKISEMQWMQKEAQMNTSTAKTELEQTEETYDKQWERLQEYTIEEKQLKEQLQSAEEKLQKETENLAKMEEEISSINQKLFLFQNNAQGENTRKEDLLQGITDLKVSISRQKESQNAIKENMKRLKKEALMLEQETTELIHQREKLAEDKAEKIYQKEEVELLLVFLGEKQNKLQTELSDITEERKLSGTLLIQYRETQEAGVNRGSNLKNQLIRLETKEEKTIEEKQRLIDLLWEEYSMTPEEAKRVIVSEIALSQLQRQAKDLRAEMKSLGYINVNAIEEYMNVKERHSFLTNQKKDILQAEEQLKDIITELGKLMEEQFKNQFTLISQNFNQVFKEMFGGGRAYLRLTDENNALESGIDIIAQPPGKTLQNMLLLSGGERALTAIAILFSILKMKPSPFCILDEIEAALDDANVRRFASYLRRFKDETQFIVITHRKGTMEAADVLYGVTMQELGVSKLVSVKFEDQAV